MGSAEAAAKPYRCDMCCVFCGICMRQAANSPILAMPDTSTGFDASLNSCQTCSRVPTWNLHDGRGTSLRDTTQLLLTVTVGSWHRQRGPGALGERLESECQANGKTDSPGPCRARPLVSAPWRSNYQGVCCSDVAALRLFGPRSHRPAFRSLPPATCSPSTALFDQAQDRVPIVLT